MIHHVFANKSNVGDWLSAKGIQALLDRPVTEHLCDEPFVPETLAALRQAKVTDLIVIGGGGLFMDYFVPFWEGFREIAARVPFCIWGVGYCHMKREDSRPPGALLEEIVKLSRLCIVRDALTREYLEACALPSSIGCPTMNVIDPAEAGFGVLHVDAFDNVGEANYEAMEAMAKTVAEKSGRPFHSINNLIPADNQKALAGVLARYREADLILAGRLHGCIIGLAMGRKVLAVSGDYKVESFMSAAGLRDWVLDLDEINLVFERLRQLLEQAPSDHFVAKTRAANEAVAVAIRAMHG